MFKSTGTLTYGPGIRAALLVDQGIADFYRSLIPIQNNPQRYAAHVSVVRREAPNMEFWGKYEGKQIEFQYSNEIRNDETYLWLDVECERLQQIRVEMGLPAYPWWRNKYHITLANVKGF